MVARMALHPRDALAQAKALGLTTAEFCRRAEIQSETTPHHWRKDENLPHWSTWNRVLTVFEEAEHEARQRVTG